VEYDGVICFSCGDWWYHNRGHFDMQVMKRMARTVPVLYVNAMGMRFPSTREGRMFATRILRKLRSVSRGFVKYAKDFYVLSPFSVPVYTRPLLRRINVHLVRAQVQIGARLAGIRCPLMWVVSPPAMDVICPMRRAAIVYQRTDDFKEFPGVNSRVIAEMDQRLVAQADLVVHVNRGLHEEVVARGGRSFLTGHGVDYDLFAADGDERSEPHDIACIPHPRVGFFGGIDSHTFDTDLLRCVASLLPDISFVLVGAASIDVSAFEGLGNVYLLGKKPYEDIPSYGRHFDVAMMPWRQNKWIRACNPVKMKEYLALGKPVVSTPFPEGESYSDVIYFARDAQAFAASIQHAFDEDSSDRKTQRRERVRGHTWDALTDRLCDAIQLSVSNRCASPRASDSCMSQTTVRQALRGDVIHSLPGTPESKES